MFYPSFLNILTCPVYFHIFACQCLFFSPSIYNRFPFISCTFFNSFIIFIMSYSNCFFFISVPSLLHFFNNIQHFTGSNIKYLNITTGLFTQHLYTNIYITIRWSRAYNTNWPLCSRWVKLYLNLRFSQRWEFSRNDVLYIIDKLVVLVVGEWCEWFHHALRFYFCIICIPVRLIHI